MGAQGSALLDFGAYPGASEATLDVAAQAGFIATSSLEVWLAPKATVEHSVDEHMLEEIAVFGYYVADGTFRIYGRWDGNPPRCNNGDNLYGRFNCGWVWV